MSLLALLGSSFAMSHCLVAMSHCLFAIFNSQYYNATPSYLSLCVSLQLGVTLLWQPLLLDFVHKMCTYLSNSNPYDIQYLPSFHLTDAMVSNIIIHNIYYITI